MVNPKNLIVFLASFLLLSFFCGCASFRSGQPRQISKWPPEPTTRKKSISITVSGEASLNEKVQDVNATLIKTWSEQTVKAYRESGLFSDVKTGLTKSSLRAEVEIIDQGKANLGLAFLTGLTLYLVPSNATDEFVVKTTIKDQNGKTLGVFERTEAVTMWQQAFLIFAMPFNFPGTIVKDTIYDLNREIINQANAEGIY